MSRWEEEEEEEETMLPVGKGTRKREDKDLNQATRVRFLPPFPVTKLLTCG